MLLSDLFEQLTNGELSQLEMGGVDGIGIEPCDYNRVIPHINLGMTELYKRFPIRRQEVIIQQYDQIQKYKLDSRYAQTNTDSEEPIKYVMDSKYEPFTDNVLKIERIFNEDGQELYNCERDEYWSVNLPAYNVIQVPYPEKENNLSITYRADHDKIKIPGLNPATTHIEVPPSLLEPLLLFIAARVYSNLSSLEGNEGNNYMAKFEASCRKITELNLIPNDNTKNIKLDENGWV